MKKTIAILFLLLLMTLCLTGCQQKTEVLVDTAALADYLADVEKQADAIRTSLEKDELTQTEMNQKSGELSDLWDAAMNRMLGEAEKALPAAEMKKLTAEQSAWLVNRTQLSQAAGKDVEGGSMYALVVNSEAAKLTEARVRELYAMLK